MGILMREEGRIRTRNFIASEPMLGRHWPASNKVRNRKMRRRQKLVWLKKSHSLLFSFFHKKSFFFFLGFNTIWRKKKKMGKKKCDGSKSLIQKEEEEVKQNKFRSKKMFWIWIFRLFFHSEEGETSASPGNGQWCLRRRSEATNITTVVDVFLFFYLSDGDLNFFTSRWRSEKKSKERRNCEKVDFLFVGTHHLPFPGFCLKTGKVSILRLLLWTVINFFWSYFDEGKKPKGRSLSEREFLIAVDVVNVVTVAIEVVVNVVVVVVNVVNVVVVNVVAVVVFVAVRHFWTVLKFSKVRWKTNKSEAKMGSRIILAAVVLVASIKTGQKKFSLAETFKKNLSQTWSFALCMDFKTQTRSYKQKSA